MNFIRHYKKHKTINEQVMFLCFCFCFVLKNEIDCVNKKQMKQKNPSLRSVLIQADSTNFSLDVLILFNLSTKSRANHTHGSSLPLLLITIFVFYCIITRMQPKAMARYIHFGQSKYPFRV